MPVPCYEGLYEVSDLGRVLSLGRPSGSAPSQRGYPAKVLKPSVNSNGYLTVSLNKDGTGCTHDVHRLVALTFLGPCPLGKQVAHGPNGPGNASLANISYKPLHENNGADKYRDGTQPIGERNHQSKLTDAERAEIRRLYDSERHLPRCGGKSPDGSGRRWTYRTLASKFGLSERAVAKIIKQNYR